MFSRCNSTLSAYLKNSGLPGSLKNHRLPGYLKNPGLSASLKNSRLSASLKNSGLPTSLKNSGLPASLKNPRLSAYLKNPRLRTQASVTLAVAAAAAGIGAASASAGAAPWSAPLNSMVVGIHPATGQQAAPAAQPKAGHAQLADGQHSAPGGTGKSQAGAIQALRALPVAHHAAPAQKPAAAKVAAPAKFAAPAKPAAPAQPYTVYDSVTPTSIPAGKEVATYANGHYQASWSELHGRHNVLWIDTNGSNPDCNALDVEPGDATPSGAAQWVQDRLTAQPHAIAIVYTMRSEWQQVQDAIATLPNQMQSQVQYWIADPTGVPHIVPGSSATQWYWGANYDVTAALPQFNQ